MSSKAVEARIDAMLRTLDVGKSSWARLTMRLSFLAENTAEWLRCVRRSFAERKRFPVFGDRTRDQKGGKALRDGSQGAEIHVSC
jgi:hypothetical protein